MNFDKFPRWALVAICGVFMTVTLFFTNRAIAESDKVKSVAYGAQNISLQNQRDIADLKSEMSEMRMDQKSFLSTYRDDQKDLDRKVDILIRASRAA